MRRIGLSDEQVAALDFDIEVPRGPGSGVSGGVKTH